MSTPFKAEPYLNYNGELRKASSLALHPHP